MSIDTGGATAFWWLPISLFLACIFSTMGRGKDLWLPWQWSGIRGPARTAFIMGSSSCAVLTNVIGQSCLFFFLSHYSTEAIYYFCTEWRWIHCLQIWEGGKKTYIGMQIISTHYCSIPLRYNSPPCIFISLMYLLG